jgi:putative ABC transport system substrate-binding protein
MAPPGDRGRPARRAAAGARRRALGVPVVRVALAVPLVAALLGAPCAAVAQPAGRTARVGWLAGGRQADAPSPYLEAFRLGMRERGRVEGRNLVLEVRVGERDRAPELAAELVRLKVDVLVAAGPMVYDAARAAAGSTPVVFGFSGDPVEAGLVASLAHPGGNLTGISLLSFEVMGKRLELMTEALPGLARVAVLANPVHPGERSELRETQAAAGRLGLAVQYVPVRSAADFAAGFAAIERERAQAILAFPDALIMSQARAIADFSVRQRVPAVSGWAEFAMAGNFMSYGPSLRESWRRAAGYVDLILRGARPGELPVEQPTRFELVINRKVAEALGVTLPPSLLVRADRIIE